MKKKCISAPALVTLAVGFLFFGVLMYGIWTTKWPPSWGKPFPEGTQIIQQTDTHQGFFRWKGLRVEVVRIPEQHIQEFGDRLRREGFIPARPGEQFEEFLNTVETAEGNFDSWDVLSNFSDGSIAFIEEPCSDWERAAYDLKTGIFCIIEYDE